MSRKPSRLTVGDIDRLRAGVRQGLAIETSETEMRHLGGLLVALEDLRACVEHAATERAEEGAEEGAEPAPVVGLSAGWRCKFCGVLLVCTRGIGPKGGQCPGCGTVQEARK